MTLIDIFKVLRERWLVLVICVVLGLAGAVAANLALPKQYEARMSLFVASRVISNDPSKVYEGTLLAQQRVNSYAALLTSDRVTGDVVAARSARPRSWRVRSRPRSCPTASSSG